MRYRHLFWAIILIAIGILAILGNLNIINISWFNFWRLWPLILIFWGIAILPVRDITKFVLLFVTILATFLLFRQYPDNSPSIFGFHRHGDNFNFGWDSDDDESSADNYKAQNFTVPFDTACTKGILSLDAAAGNFAIEDTTADLLYFKKSGYIGNYELTSAIEHGRKKINLKLNESRFRKSIRENKVTIKLGQQVPWNLNFDIGAAEVRMDLSKYRIDTAEFTAGAATMDIRLGDLNPVTSLKFSAGASSIKINIPKTSGCRISSDSFLVSKEFEGFIKNGDHTYETPGFANSTKKIYIRVETAVSKIRVERY